MGRSPCCDENGLKKGPWTSEEDALLINYINRNGHGSWRALPKLAGLKRCGKSCRLRWTNYLRPDIKRGKFTDEEEQIIINLHAVLGNKWSAIATHLPGRTDNEIKNFWNTHLRKKLLHMGIDPVTHRPRTDHLNLLQNLPQLLANLSNNPIINPWGNVMTSIQTDQIAKFQLLQNILQVLSPNPPPSIELLNILDHQNQQIFENNIANKMGYDSRFDGIGNSSIDLGTHPQVTSSFPILNMSEITDQNIRSMSNLKGFNDIQVNENSLPSLVSFSPECSTVNQIENQNNPKNDLLSNLSSATSTTFEANWGEIMGDEAGDSYWKEIIDQATSPSWPNSRISSNAMINE